jgi:hypothetical protein
VINISDIVETRYEDVVIRASDEVVELAKLNIIVSLFKPVSQGTSQVAKVENGRANEDPWSSKLRLRHADIVAVRRAKRRREASLG